MARRTQYIEPTPLAELRRRAERADAVPDGLDVLRAALGPLAEIRLPGEAEEPILAPGPRSAIFQWLSEIRASDDLAAVGLRPRSTALLYGPPGCGKTTLAHHLAMRLGLPLVVVGSENLYEAALGSSERNAARLFAALAEVEGQCICLLDEIDAIGSKRREDADGGAQAARNSMLTVILRRIESFKGILLAATNREDTLDAALWRRFHLQISIDLPGEVERFAILRRYGLPFAFADDEVDLLARITEGASPALLRALMEGAKRTLVLAARAKLETEPVSVFRSVIAAVAPPPEITPPPLWAQPEHWLPELKAIAWPPEREGPSP